MAYWGGRRLCGALCPGAKAAELRAAPAPAKQAGGKSVRTVMIGNRTSAERRSETIDLVGFCLTAAISRVLRGLGLALSPNAKASSASEPNSCERCSLRTSARRARRRRAPRTAASGVRRWDARGGHAAPAAPSRAGRRGRARRSRARIQSANSAAQCRQRRVLVLPVEVAEVVHEAAGADHQHAFVAQRCQAPGRVRSAGRRCRAGSPTAAPPGCRPAGTSAATAPRRHGRAVVGRTLRRQAGVGQASRDGGGQSGLAGRRIADLVQRLRESRRSRAPCAAALSAEHGRGRP